MSKFASQKSWLQQAASSTSQFLSPYLRKLNKVRSKIPWLRTLRFNFIFFHYTYIIGVTIVGSIYLYPGGKMSYTDALFFAAGSATQSGLNTIDLNLLSTYQQVGLWLGSMIANPIVIHSSLVFIRLRSFEKRFKHVVNEAKALRRTRTRTRTRSRTVTVGVDDQAVHRAEMGVRGRKIMVLRNSEGLALGHAIESQKQNGNSEKKVNGVADHPPLPDEEGPNVAGLNAADDTVPPPKETHLRPPEQYSAEHHIAFVENQRRPSRPLRIPSPREYDRGGMPETVEEPSDTLTRRVTTQSDQGLDPKTVKPNPPPSQHITIDEPNIIRSRRATTFPTINSRNTAENEPEGGEDPAPQRRSLRRPTLSSFFTGWNDEDTPYLSWQPTIGRNSAFASLTDEQKNELGGIEYRALKTLAVVLVSYFFFFHILSIVALVPWILHTHWGKFVTDVGVGRPWWAVFIAGSAFNDQGFSLTPNSLASFYNAVFPLLFMTFTIIIGNTGFPCMLRFIIWSLWKIFPNNTAIWEELHFLLDHPRRCFTLLFPSSATWWLFWVLVLLNGTDLILFVVLDLNDKTVQALPSGLRFVDGLFQAAATRTAGLSVISLTDLHPAVQVSYMIMMYISIYPIAISLRRTNVYEEKSLGIYYADDEPDEDSSREPSYVASHLRRQLGFDIWYIFLGLFIIAIVEGSRLEKDPAFTMFAILFEVVSAYGTVGLSLGYPNTNTSFSAQFKVISKLVIIAMMIRGRHRGLPYELDRAVLLPSEALHEKETRDATMRVKRRNSAISGVATSHRASIGSRDAAVGESTGWQRRNPFSNGNAQ